MTKLQRGTFISPILSLSLTWKDDFQIWWELFLFKLFTFIKICIEIIKEHWCYSNTVLVERGRSLKGTTWIIAYITVEWNDLRSMKCLYNNLKNPEKIPFKYKISDCPVFKCQIKIINDLLKLTIQRRRLGESLTVFNSQISDTSNLVKN